MPRCPSRWEPRRPDESPTRGAKRPHSVFDLSVEDAGDKFRPQHCPSCGVNHSGVANVGYLCNICTQYSRPEVRLAFKDAAASICSGCEEPLTDEEHLAQYYVCKECNPHKREVQHAGDRQLVMRVRGAACRPGCALYDKSMGQTLFKRGCCRSSFCGKQMTMSDFYDETTSAPYRFTSCEECREELAKNGMPEVGRRLSTDPIPKHLLDAPCTPKIGSLEDYDAQLAGLERLSLDTNSATEASSN